MPLFPHAHATHPNWAMAAGLVLAQLRAQMASATRSRKRASAKTTTRSRKGTS